MIPPDLHSQMLRMLDGELSSGELAALESELETNPEARKAWQRLSRLHSALEVHYESQANIEKMPVVPIDRILTRQRRRIVNISTLAAAAVVLVSAVALWMNSIPKRPVTIAGFQAAPNSVFTLSHSEGDDAPLANVLAEGSRITLEHGVVELTLPHEVLAIIEAPATLVLLDTKTLQLDHGRAFFQVSSEEGKGFTVVTPQQRIVDLGTAFGIDSHTDRSEVELHVFEGKVRIESLDGGQGAIIKANRSVLLAGPQIKHELDGPPTAFRRKLPTKVETVLHEDFESGLVGGRDYAIQMDPTAIRGFSRNRFPGIDDNETWNFTTPPRGPAGQVLASFNLGRSTRLVSGDVPIDSNPNGLQFTGTGGTWANITIDTPSATSNGMTLTFDPANGWQNTNGNRSSMGSGALRIYPDITSGDIPWTLTGLTPHAFYDMIWYNKRVSPGETRHPNTGVTGFDAGNGVGASAPLDGDLDQNFIGIQADGTGSISGTWFRDGGKDIITSIAGVQIGISGIPDSTPPTVTRLHPPHFAPGTTPFDKLTVQFNESVQRGTGNIVIREPAGGGILETIPINSDRVSIRSSILTIRPAHQPSTACSVEITAGALTDLANNPFPGIEGPNAWTLSPAPEAKREPAPTAKNGSPPTALTLHPSHDLHEVTPGQLLEITFGEPIKLGTGRITIRNTTDWIESELVVGDPRLSIEGNTLSINPPADLQDGSMPMGWVGNWAADLSAGLLNPRGDGSHYREDKLNDETDSKGTIGSMRGPTMATFSKVQPYSKIRHELGPIAADRRYTVSVAIGVRAEQARQPAAFLGYTIRLVSGDSILAELSDNTPPGPPNSVTNVGFSWDSSTLPEGVTPGDPLTIEIAPNQASGPEPGYLDLDNVHVTVVGE